MGTTTTLEISPVWASAPGTRPTSPDAGPPAPLVRASRAWTALKVSRVLESLAFLARGVERGRRPRDSVCPEHVVGPLVGTIIGPVGGPLPRDAVEELFPRAADARGVTEQEWREWQRARYTPHLLEDVTMLAHRGSCLGRSDQVRCTCDGGARAGTATPDSLFTRHLDADLGPVPALIPDPSGGSDPWQDALAELARSYRGPGSPLSSKYSGGGPPSIHETRTLVAHLDRLAGAFAGPRRADRMAGLGRVTWAPPLPVTCAWQARDMQASAERARAELFERLLCAAGCSPGQDAGMNRRTG